MVIEYVEIPERLQNIAKLRESGKTFSEIGKEIGVSRGRASQLYKQYLAKLEFNEKMGETLAKDSLLKLLYLAQQELSVKPTLITRTYNCIRRASLDYNKIFAGEYSDEYYLSLRNFGVASLKLLHKVIDIHDKIA